MKKILVILLVFFLSVQPVNAKDTSFELTDERGMKGETITVKLEINDNPSFGILGATLDYDETKLEYKSSKIIGLDNAFMKDYDNNNGQVMMYAFCIDRDSLMDDTGNIFEVEFEVISEEVEQSKIKLEITDFAIDETETLNYTTKDSTITINQEIETVSSSESISLKDEIESETEEIVEWKSSNSDVAKVDENGNVTFKKNGDVTITATSNDNIIFEKNYKVNNKGFNNTLMTIGGIIIGVIIIALATFYIIKRKKKNGKKES